MPRGDFDKPSRLETPKRSNFRFFEKIMKIYANGANIEEKVGILRQNRNISSTGRQTYDFVGDG